MGVLTIPNLVFNYRAQSMYSTMNPASGLEAQVSLGALARAARRLRLWSRGDDASIRAGPSVEPRLRRRTPLCACGPQLFTDVDGVAENRKANRIWLRRSDVLAMVRILWRFVHRHSR